MEHLAEGLDQPRQTEGAPEPLAAGRPPAPRVDHHQHLFSPDMVQLLGSRSRNAPAEIAAADLVELLDAAGIERALVLSVAYLHGSPALGGEDEYARVRAENDWTRAQVSRFSERLSSFCSFNPLKGYALDELARCTGTHRGLKLHLANSDVQLDDVRHIERLRHVFAVANTNAMPIVVHLRANIGNRRPYGAHHARAFMEEVLPAAPDVPVQVAHLAGTGPGYDDPPADEAVAAFVRALEAGDERVRTLWFDVAGLAHDAMTPAEAARMAERIRQIGIDRILFGSDAATTANPAPREAWAALCRLPLRVGELGVIAERVASYAPTGLRPR